MLGLGLLAVITVGAPLGMVAYWLTKPGAAATTPVAASAARLWHAAEASVGFGVAAAALTVALAVPLGFLAVRHPGQAVMELERATFLSQGAPGIVVALALASLTARALQSLNPSATLLVVAYAILFLPLALVSARRLLARRGQS